MSNFAKCEEEKVNYQLLEDGTFVIDNYNQASPFSSFFPGIAGLKGIPMWAFYVNRNQCMSSFGLANKHYSIMEFHPANTAYGNVSNYGFRTFIKIKKENGILFYEPFACKTGSSLYNTKQKMLIKPHELCLEEVNETLGLKTVVRYLTLPQEPIAALIRIVEFENIGNEKLDLEIVDGLPKLIPYWMSADILKAMSYTAQAWTTVTNFEKTGLPFYRLKVEINDSPEVSELKKGNFYFGIVDTRKEKYQSKIIIDPEIVFGADNSMSYPGAFMNSLSFDVPKKQSGSNKYPSALSFFSLNLAAGTKQTLYSMVGHIGSEEKLNEYFLQVKVNGYFSSKAQENKCIIEDLTQSVHTESSKKEFDLYCKQTYLDNLLRGGMPIILPAGNKNVVYYVYSRKHGDLERDYNFFQLAPSYYSQGNGNFRDMNQNKRSDVFFNPKIRDFNIISFYNLVQLDGYNPLVVKGSSFILNVSEKKRSELIGEFVEKKYANLLKSLMAEKFDPGSLLLNIEEKNIKLKVSPEKFLEKLLCHCERLDEADHGEGFWADHWTYNIDHLESYLSLYPEKLSEILVEKKEFTFYDNSHIVLPRSHKHVNADGKIRQFGSVCVSEAKEKLMAGRERYRNLVRDRKGKGDVYRTTLLVKMICLLVNKVATLDPDGIGIEMEADKPCWYDALNGLPGVFGSSVSESFELKRMVQFLQEKLSSMKIGFDYKIALPEEIYKFFMGLDNLLKQKKRISDISFWAKASSLKEKYRESVVLGVTGKEKYITYKSLNEFLKKVIEKINSGLARAKDKKTNLYNTYYLLEAVEYKANGNRNIKGLPCVNISKFKRKALPLFLEGEVHYMKTEKNTNKIKMFHRSVKNSQLYDKKLKMYKVNASLEQESTDIGRCTVFSPGWLENESIWLHMEYKYLLELLRSGLYEEFFAEFSKAGVCFQDPDVYGRSIIENSSFIVSSAFPDKRLWGRGFVARLSGSTAEFIQMWLLMTVGLNPFRIDSNNQLTLEFNPAIPEEFFTKQNTFSFMFLGKTLVRYYNTKRVDTYSSTAIIKKINIEWFEGGTDSVNGKAVKGDQASRIRNQEAKQIEVFF